VSAGRIVVGVDGSESSTCALRWALDEAETRGAGLTVLMAWDYLSPPGRETFDPAYDEEVALEVLDGIVRPLAAERPAVPVETRAVCDFPARALLEAAADADLLVVGARGLGGFAGLLLGSVSQQCVTHAPCPVVVVHGSPGPEPTGPSTPRMGDARPETAGPSEAHGGVGGVDAPPQTGGEP
jgi:nucleotide-binding universal stress UspA family protein